MASHIAAVAILALAFLAAGIDSYAATLVVTKTADTADGICDSDCSLREAVFAAASGDTVAFSPLFDEPRTITLTLGQILITQNLTVSGPGQGLLTISGNKASRIVRITGGALVNVSGLKLTNGLASGTGDAVGGAIYQTGGSLTLSNVTISNNVARQANQPTFGVGGGICVETGVLSINDSTIDNNIVPPGDAGGVYSAQSTVNIGRSSISHNTGTGIGGSGGMTLIDSVVIGNSGSALSNLTGSAHVTGSTVSNNGAGVIKNSSGGILTIHQSVISDNNSLGVANSGAVATISNSVIRNNANDQFGRTGGGVRNTGTMYILNTSIINNIAFEAGGGIYNVLGDLYLTNSTVSGNLVINGTGNSPCPGGGIANIWNATNPGATVVLTNSTVTDNTAQGIGGGICNQTGGTVTTRNSIIAQNTGTAGPDISGAISSEGYNLIGNTLGSSGWTPHDLQNLNPQLAPLGNNGGGMWTHALLPDSPGVGAGNNELARDPLTNLLLTSDQRGFPRVFSIAVDIGAYEAGYASGPVTVSGRVLVNSVGRAISNARVTLTDPMGTVRYTQTNPSGYYRFLNLEPGTSYTVRVSHKSYQFDSPQVVTIDQPRDDLDFVALGHWRRTRLSFRRAEKLCFFRPASRFMRLRRLLGPQSRYPVG